MEKRDSGALNHDTLVTVLSTVFAIVGVVLIAVVGIWFLQSRRRRRIFNRGLTPIGDEEIATWKVGRSDDKETEAYGGARPSHASKESTSSARIQYQKSGGGSGGARPSTDTAMAPRSFINGGGFSMDLPRAPEAAAFARAPNARTGLTDEAIPGDDPFVPPLKRQPSRLTKLPPGLSRNPSRSNSRARIARSQSHSEHWHRSAESSPSGSRATSSYGVGGGGGGGHSRIYSSSSIPPQLPGGDRDAYVGLSPPPSRRQQQQEIIGQALG
ncbi:hypothetical protein SAMD00023353_0105220 [Rosellinia necatrix]|uniref:Uncharacterized protein n=1 Tax=Rosellinia necatrix TaxID=77044 RepID=A0A1S7UIC0_ROSNE|nr:hypothetical protein SAMD00023353_0105220 [Rosellinia necatrix]